MKDAAFYMVLADRQPYTTQHRHPTFESAKDEAKRLAKKHAGTKFYVLSSCGFHQVAEPDTWTGHRAKLPEFDVAGFQVWPFAPER